MDNGLKELLDRRCRRSIAIVLSAKEKDIDPHVPVAAQTSFRKVVLDQFNEFAALAGDLIESASKDAVYNQLWLDKIAEIHNVIVGSDVGSG
jgi:hypothetical protein